MNENKLTEIREKFLLCSPEIQQKVLRQMRDYASGNSEQANKFWTEFHNYLKDEIQRREAANGD